MPFEDFTEVPGISAFAQAAEGDPANLPVAVPGVDFARHRAYIGNGSTPVELRLSPNITVVLSGVDVSINLPSNPSHGQVYGVRFLGALPDEQQVAIVASEITPFRVTGASGSHETSCIWDIPARNTEAWFQCVSLEGQLYWDHM